MSSGGRSKQTSPWMTISRAPVALSPTEAPEENFLPNTLAASFIFRSNETIYRLKMKIKFGGFDEFMRVKRAEKMEY